MEDYKQIFIDIISDTIKNAKNKKRISQNILTINYQCDIKFIWLAGGNKPTRNVINSFRKDKYRLANYFFLKLHFCVKLNKTIK